MSTNTFSGSFVKASNQYAALANNAGITGGTITIEAWIKPATTPSGGGLNAFAFQGSTTNRVGYMLFYWDDSGTVKLTAMRDRGGVGDNRASYNVTLSTSDWIHTVLWYDAGTTTLKLYTAPPGGTHTERASTSASGNGTSFDDNTIGISGNFTGGFAAPSQFWNGLIDEVRIWNTARTVSELNANFETELTGTETGLVAYYRMNNNWNDTTPNAYNLTPVNSPTFSTDVPFTGAGVTNSNFLMFM